MSKPIDEQWETHRIAPYDQPGVCTTNGLSVAEVVVRYVPDGRTSRRDIETADAEAALIAASPDMARALLPLARFVEAFDAKPIRGIDDTLYGIHAGSENEAEIRLSDLRLALAALRKAKVLP